MTISELGQRLADLNAQAQEAIELQKQGEPFHDQWEQSKKKAKVIQSHLDYDKVPLKLEWEMMAVRYVLVSSHAE